jgi:dissimilatory sulfite reductase (desulfoviridin) alpha/beta subunit
VRKMGYVKFRKQVKGKVEDKEEKNEIEWKEQNINYTI